MSVSLKKVDEKISAKKRSLASLIEARQETFAKADAVADQIDSIQSTEDFDSEALAALVTEHRELNSSISNLGEDIRVAEDELHALRVERTNREDHNRQEALLREPAERSVPSDNPEPPKADNEPAPRVTVSDLTSEQKDHDIAAFFRNSYLAKQYGYSIGAVCAGQIGDQYRNDRLHAAVTKSTAPNILPDGYQPRLIELLGPRSVVRQMAGIRNLSMVNGSLRIPRQNAGSTANYVGEMVNIPLSTPTTNEVTLASKKLTVMVVQSGELMRQSNPSSDRMILDDVVTQLARKEDLTFLRATQSSTVPGGFKYFADNGGFTTAANGTVNVANVTDDLGKLILGLRNADVPMLNPYFVIAPRTERWLMDSRDGNGNYAFPELQLGNIRGIPYLTTTQLPIDLGAGTDESEVYLVDASEFILADSPTFDLGVSFEAAYDDAGTVKAAYSQDAVVFRLIVEHDTAMRHNESVGYLSAVTWGA
jgi:HK97 family phage major capsid protein